MKSRGLLVTVALFCALLALGLFVAGALAARPHSAPPSSIAPQAASYRFATTTKDTYYVAKVVDGDTNDVMMAGVIVRIRLIGIDTPETVDPRKPVQCFGAQASAEAHTLLDGQWVRLEYDSAAGKTDAYGRTLAYEFLPDGTSYNEFMVREGFAHEYDFKGEAYKYRAAFEAAQANAKRQQLGFWSPSTCRGNTTKPAS